MNLWEKPHQNGISKMQHLETNPTFLAAVESTYSDVETLVVEDFSGDIQKWLTRHLQDVEMLVTDAQYVHFFELLENHYFTFERDSNSQAEMGF
jgi:hypothetical protein